MRNKGDRHIYLKVLIIIVLALINVSVTFIVALPVSAQEVAEQSSTKNKPYLLSLDEVSVLAVGNNLDIQIAKYDAYIARVGRKEARSLYDAMITGDINYRDDQTAQTSTVFGTKTEEYNYNVGYEQKLPTGTTINVDLDNQRNFTNSSFATSSVTHESTGKITLTQELTKNFFGINDRNAVKLAEVQAVIGEYSSLEKIEMQLAEVQRAYWQLVLSKGVVDVQRNQMDQAKRLYESQEEKIKHGLTEKPELFSSQANYESRKSDVMLADDAVASAVANLRLMLNIEDDVIIEPKEKFLLFNEYEDLDKTLKEAFSNRSDYKRLRKQVDAKNIELVINKNESWPEVNLVASIARNGLDDHFNQAIEKIEDEDNPEYYIGVQIKIPLGNNAAEASAERSALEKAKLLLELKLLERTIAIQVADQVRHVNVLNEKAAQSQLVAELHDKKLNAEEDRLQKGRSDLDTIIRFQNDVLLAQLQAFQSMFDYKAAVVELRRLEGSLLSHYWTGEL